MGRESSRGRDRFSFISSLAFVASIALAPLHLSARGEDLMKCPTMYRRAKVDGLSIFPWRLDTV
jgi:hypothetical protein